MKIYFIGSTSVGKTTLARYTSEKLKLPLLTEVARTVLAEKELQIDSLRTNIEVVNSYQKEIFLRQIKEEQKYSKFVSDRSFDCLAYTAQYASNLKELIDTQEYKEYMTNIHSKDVKIFFIRPTKATLKADGVRENLVWDNIIAVDAMIKFLIEMNDLKYIPINTESMQERIKLINTVLT